MLKGKPRIAKIRKILRTTYSDVKTQLHYRSPFQLLVSTILSAQCTDKQVNSVTEDLFNVLPGPREFVDAPIETLEQLIRPTGYFRNKAKNIKKCSGDLIEKYGAVSEQVAEAMAKSARKKAGTDFTIATTGIAGPEGGSEQKPVGLVYIAVSSEKHCRTRRFVFSHTRETIRQRTAQAALNMLRMELES